MEHDVESIEVILVSVILARNSHASAALMPAYRFWRCCGSRGRSQRCAHLTPRAHTRAVPSQDRTNRSSLASPPASWPCPGASVRYQIEAGEHILTLRISGFDPDRV